MNPSRGGDDDDEDDQWGEEERHRSPGDVSTEDAGVRKEEKGEAVEIMFLSTARAGTVIVRESEVERAVRALQRAVDVVREEG